MRKSFFTLFASSLLCASLFVFTSCGTKEVTVEDYVKVAKNATGGEEVELLNQESTDCYSFKSTKRDLVFKVWTTPDEVVMNGTNYGYSGDVSFYDDYADVLHMYYEEDLLQLITDSGFETMAQSDSYQYSESLCIIVNSSASDEDKDRFNNLLSGIQNITDSEQQYHREGLAVVMYSVSVWIEEDGNYYLTSYYNPSEKSAETEVFIEGGTKALTYNSFKRTDVQATSEVTIPEQNGLVIRYIPVTAES